MKAHATRGGGRAIGGQVLRLKRNDFVEPILQRAAQRIPEARTTLLLYRETMAAMDKLALHAAGSTHRKGRFAVAMLVPICVETALLVARARGPGSGTEDFLAQAVVLGVQRFSDAVEAEPERFVNAARDRWNWPVLWAVKDNAKRHKALAVKLELGARKPLKAKGAFNLDSLSNAAVVDALDLLKHLRCLFRGDPELRLVKPTLRPLARIEFPPLTKDAASVDFWWKNGIEPILEDGKAWWLATSGPLNEYKRRAAQPEITSRKDAQTGRYAYRAKTDTQVWSWFLKDCKDALKRFVGLATEKTRKKP